MVSPPRLTDRTALALHRARAGRQAERFLLDRVADDLQERLQSVNRTFQAPAVVTGLPDVFGDLVSDAAVVPDTDAIDLAPASHDLVIHALSLHWADDPVGQLVQCRHALRPDGLLLAALFAGRTLEEVRAALADAESRLTGGLSPRVAPMADIRDLGGLLQRAGFALPVSDSDVVRVSYSSLADLARDLRGMGESNALYSRLRRPSGRALFRTAETFLRDTFPAGDGRFFVTFEIVTLTGWAPDASQPQPLRPGSASHRLAEALGVPEHPAEGSDRS